MSIFFENQSSEFQAYINLVLLVSYEVGRSNNFSLNHEEVAASIFKAVHSAIDDGLDDNIGLYNARVESIVMNAIVLLVEAAQKSVGELIQDEGISYVEIYMKPHQQLEIVNVVHDICVENEWDSDFLNLVGNVLAGRVPLHWGGKEVIQKLTGILPEYKVALDKFKNH